MALRQLDMDVTVLERVNDLRKIQVGGAYVLWNNAMRALDELGLADRIQEVASRPLEHFELRSWQNRPILYWPVTLTVVRWLSRCWARCIGTGSMRDCR